MTPEEARARILRRNAECPGETLHVSAARAAYLDGLDAQDREGGVGGPLTASVLSAYGFAWEALADTLGVE